MTLSAFTIGLTFILLLVYADKILSWFAENMYTVQVVEESGPIVYPMEPMFENYGSICDDINKAESVNDLNACYVRMVIFSGCYEDSAPFTSDLFTLYWEKELEII